MALAVFFLLTGTLAAEVSLLGVPEMGYVGSVLLFLSATTLLRLWWVGYPEPVLAHAVPPHQPRSVTPART